MILNFNFIFPVWILLLMLIFNVHFHMDSQTAPVTLHCYFQTMVGLTLWLGAVTPKRIRREYGSHAIVSNPSSSNPVWRGQRIVGGELCHLTGLPGDGEDLVICDILIQVHTVWIKWNTTLKQHCKQLQYYPETMLYCWYFISLSYMALGAVNLLDSFFVSTAVALHVI